MEVVAPLLMDLDNKFTELTANLQSVVENLLSNFDSKMAGVSKDIRNLKEYSQPNTETNSPRTSTPAINTKLQLQLTDQTELFNRKF